jgi:hypothetical protein
MNNTPRTILNGVVVALLAGTILGLVPSLYDATSFLSRSRVFEQITIGMPEETAAQILSRENIACGLSVRQEHTCWFSDFWRDYEIVADSKTGTVSRLSYVRQRRRPILRRIF